jgi:hypothetical protein
MKNKTPPQNSLDAVFSVNALAKQFGHDRRTIDRFVAHIEPARVDGKTKFYRLADVEAALKEKGSAAPLREQKLAEEIRKLRIYNDAKEGKMEQRAVTVARIQRLGQDVCAYLGAVAKEKPATLAMTPEDIPRVRIEFQKVCDEMLRKFQGFAEHWGVKI